MKLALALLLVSATAAAAPTQVVAVEVELDQLGGPLFSNLPAAESEPGGLLVPASADPAWFQLGLKPGDVIRAMDSSPVSGRIIISPGVTLLEVERGKKLLMFHITVHGDAVEKARLNETDFDDLVARVTDPEPRTEIVRRGSTVTGVRVVDILLHFTLELDPGDLVRTIGGQRILSNAAFAAALKALPVGLTLIEIERFGRNMTIEIERVAPIDIKQITRVSATRFDVPRSIVAAVVNDKGLLDRGTETVRVIEADETRGIRLFKVGAGSLLAELGLQTNDVVVAIEGRSIRSLSIYDALQQFSSAPQITIQIERRQKRVTMTYVIRE